MAKTKTEAAKPARRSSKATGKTTSKTAGKSKATTKAPAKKKAPAKPKTAAKKRAQETSSDENTQKTAGTLPVLYQNPIPLSAQNHKTLALKEKTNYAFAAETNSVPINAAEFKFAVKYYPIVFTGTAPLMSVVILGLRDAENLFVDAKGNWDAGAYIPAYIRRYPFIFMSGPDRERFVLCIDESSDHLNKGRKQRLFEDGEASDITKRALSFCSAYQNQSDYTKAFAAEMEARDLLIANRAEIMTPSGEKVALGGFRVIDEERFNALDDATFLEWRRKGWLHLIYSHLLSASNGTRLIRHNNA